MSNNAYVGLTATDLRDKSMAIINELKLIFGHEEDQRASIEVLMHTLCVLIVTAMPKEGNSAVVTSKFMNAFSSKMFEVSSARFGDVKVTTDSLDVLLKP